MNVTCEKCGKKYVVADEKVAGKASVKIRCKQCQNLITVAGIPAGATAAPAAVAMAGGGTGTSPALGGAPEGNPWEEERTKAMPALDLQTTWFAMIQGKQAGPFDLKQLQGKVNEGEVTLRTYLWKPGMGDWKRASDVPEVSPVFAGVAVGATATGPTASATAPAKAATAPQQDVATANESLSDEATMAAMPSLDRSAASAPASNGAAAPAAAAAPAKTGTTGTAAAVTPDKPAEAPAAKPPQKFETNLADLLAESGTAQVAEEQKSAPAATGEVADPFAALGAPSDGQLPPPGEATKFFIAQAGVNKRNPPWKIALFLFSLIALPTAVLYGLSSMGLAKVTTVNAKGEIVQQEFFSAEGLAGFKDILSGEAKKKEAAARAAAEAAAAEKKRQADAIALANRKPKPGDTPGDVTPDPEVPKANQPNIYADLDDPTTTHTTLHVDKGMLEQGKPQVAQGGGLSDEAAGKVVAQSMNAFTSCIDNALRKNPNLKVGSITLNLTVGVSGSVKGAGMTPKKWENDEWATCMLGKGKRLVFPASDGETELQLPFKVGVGMP